MSVLSDQIDRNAFHPLPRPTDATGAVRRIGIEIEFGGLTEAAAAQAAQACLGGAVEQVAKHEFHLTGSALGTLKIYLDTAFRDKTDTMAERFGLDIARMVVPVEIVTEPLAPEALPHADALRAALRDAGAVGSGDGFLLGFAVHLNPAVAGETLADILPVVRAYALLEDWLRNADPLDFTRRVLPFAQPYPRRYVDELAAETPFASLGALFARHLRWNPTRNRGLDLLPLIAHLNPEALEALRDDFGKIGPRPVYHYRLPDCRLDDPGWSLAYEVNRWVLVERVADDAALGDALAADWRRHRKAMTSIRADWREHAEGFLRRHGLADAT